MAKADGKFFRGVVGNHVMKVYRGKQIMTMKPSTSGYRLTKATLQSAGTFGVASNLAKYMRLCFNEVLNNLHDGTMTFRMNTEVLYCLNTAKNQETQKFVFNNNSFERLTGFEFNTDAPLKNNFAAQPTVTYTETDVEVSIPEFKIPQDIKFPSEATSCKLIVATVWMDLTQGKYMMPAIQYMDVSYTHQSTTIPAHTFNIPMQTGCVCITALSLQFFKSTQVAEISLNTKNFSPMAIISASLTEGSATPKDESWGDINPNNFNWSDNN